MCKSRRAAIFCVSCKARSARILSGGGAYARRQVRKAGAIKTTSHLIPARATLVLRPQQPDKQRLPPKPAHLLMHCLRLVVTDWSGCFWPQCWASSSSWRRPGGACCRHSQLAMHVCRTTKMIHRAKPKTGSNFSRWIIDIFDCSASEGRVCDSPSAILSYSMTHS